MKTTLQKWGNSQGIRLPKAMVQSLGIVIGAEVVVDISDDRSQITIAPAKDSKPIRGRHRIEDLIAASSTESLKGEYSWGSPQGKEVW